MPDVKSILFDICADERVFADGTDLFETGLLDSYAFIELFGRLEDADIFLQPTRIDRELLRTPSGIEQLVRQASAVRS